MVQQLSTSYFKEIGKQHNQPRFVRSVKDKSKQWSHEKIWYAEGRQAESIEPDLSFKPLKIEQHCRKYDAVLYSSSEEEASHGYTGSPSLPVTRWHVMAFSWSLDLQANDYVILVWFRDYLYHIVITAQFTFSIADSELRCGMLLDLACKTRATIDIRARTVSTASTKIY